MHPTADTLPVINLNRMGRRVVPGVRWLTMNGGKQRAREIQEAIRQVLLRDWDPFGVSEVPEAQDEYDSYVGGVYRLLVSGAPVDEIIEHLYKIESETMGMPAADAEGLRGVARKLTALNVSL